MTSLPRARHNNIIMEETKIIPIYKALVPIQSPKAMALAKMMGAYEIISTVHETSNSSALKVQLGNVLAALGVAIKELEK